MAEKLPEKSIVDRLDEATALAELEEKVANDTLRGAVAMLERAVAAKRATHTAAAHELMRDTNNGNLAPSESLAVWFALHKRAANKLGLEVNEEDLLNRFALLQPGAPVLDVPTGYNNKGYLAGIVAEAAKVSFNPVNYTESTAPICIFDLKLHTDLAADAEPTPVKLSVRQLQTMVIGKDAIIRQALKVRQAPPHNAAKLQLAHLHKLAKARDDAAEL